MNGAPDLVGPEACAAEFEAGDWAVDFDNFWVVEEFWWICGAVDGDVGVDGVDQPG